MSEMIRTARGALHLLPALLSLVGGLFSLGRLPVKAAPLHNELPLVKIIVTGGTIANTPIGRIDGESLIEDVPQLWSVARLEVEEFSRLASGRFTTELWLALSRRINEILGSRTDISGVVVTQGSNAASETGFFLNLTVRSGKPVVMTAAQRRHGTLSSDGDKNLLDAVRVAASPEARGKGVLMVAHEEIHAARDVTKRVSHRPAAWDSGDLGMLGTVDLDRVTFYRQPLRRHTLRSEFDIRGLSELPRVEIIYTSVGTDGLLVNAALRKGVRGLVVAAFATGSAADPVQGGSEDEALRKAALQGIPVVVVNRGGRGRIARPGSSREPVFVAGDNLTPQKARVLLMLALTRTSDREKIQRIFDQY